MTVSVPCRAASGPPDTGASIHRIPVEDRSRVENSRLLAGSIVE
jgi:hypothetical protein